MRKITVEVLGLIKRHCQKCKEDRLLYFFQVKKKRLMYCRDCFDRDYRIKKRKHKLFKDIV